MINVLKYEEIIKALAVNDHQYLLGDLQQKQELVHIADENINIGLGKHLKYEWEKPHYHAESTEYQFVLKGKVKYLDIDNNIEYELAEGDFFVVYSNTKYMMKAKQGSVILFIKYPARNDKILIPIDEELIRWGNEWGYKYKGET